MKRIVALFALLFVCHQGIAQLYDAEGSRVFDMSQKSTRMEKFVWSIDSSQLSYQSGEKKYYYSVTSFALDEGGVINMKALDLNDDTVVVRFSPQQKMLEYYLREFGLRYYFDKVTRPKPEEDETAVADITPKPDSVLVAEQIARDTMIYDEADVMPEYPGGKSEMMSYLMKNQRYPPKAKKEGIKGFVQVNAVVEKDGTVKYCDVRKDPGGGLAEEAIRLVKSMKWTPGYKSDEAVRVRMPVTVSFMPK